MSSSVLDMSPLTDDQADALFAAAEEVKLAKQAYDEARASRERLIESVASTGATYREISHFADVSFQRVSQLLTGGEPAKWPFEATILAYCERCQSYPGEPCTDVKNGKTLKRSNFSFHAQRGVRMSGLQAGELEPSEDEPGPLTALYSAYIEFDGIMSTRGPVSLDPQSALKYGKKFDAAGVARWTGSKWERSDV